MAEPPFHIHSSGLRAAADVVDHLDEIGFSVSMAEVQPSRNEVGIHEVLVEAEGDWIEDREHLLEKVNAVQSEHAEEVGVSLGIPLEGGLNDVGGPAVLWEIHATIIHGEGDLDVG